MDRNRTRIRQNSRFENTPITAIMLGKTEYRINILEFCLNTMNRNEKNKI